MDLLTQKAFTVPFASESSSPASAKGQSSRFRQELGKAATAPENLDNSPGIDKPAHSLPTELTNSRTHLDQVKARVAALPQSSALNGIRERLSALDHEYQRIGNEFDIKAGSLNAQQLLKLQKDMYQLSENVNVVSKIVDQATSSVKSILQTNI